MSNFGLDLDQLYPLFNLLRNGTAGAFMLACHIIFRDSNRLPPILLALWVVQVFWKSRLLGYSVLAGTQYFKPVLRSGTSVASNSLLHHIAVLDGV